MIEMLSLVLFGVMVYALLIVIPALVENISAGEFKGAYFSHLASRFINSYGK